MGKDKLSWWREARFGLFIHWGLYSIPAGVWKGKKIKGIGEQILRFAQIPVSEYEKLAERFNPVEFDADAWAQLAVDAGMKYLVFGAKHHDGFAMFKSEVDTFNIVDATPFGRDVVKELAEACVRKNIKFCIYYSQRQDWHHPDGGWSEWPGQYGDDFDKSKTDFNRCLNDKCIPQVRELMTKYGPIGLVWYDTPCDSTLEQSQKCVDVVKELQPACLVCGRVGNNLGDYEVLGDNEFPYGSKNLDGEVPATLNHTWGFKSYDHAWKNVEQLLYSLIRSASNGCNYLLNIGPTAEGVVPGESVKRLREIGRWMKVNGEAVYGTGAGPYPYPFPWGMMTAKGNNLYLIFSKWPGEDFMLNGLKNKVNKAVLLGDKKCEVKLYQENPKIQEQLFLGGLPAEAPDEYYSVIKLELDGIPEASQDLIQAADDSVTLLSSEAEIVKTTPDCDLAIDKKGLPLKFHENNGVLQWNFKIFVPGKYTIHALTNRHWSKEWLPGIKVKVEVNGEIFECELTQDESLRNIQTKYHPETISHIGEVMFEKAGNYNISLEVSEMPEYKVDNPLSEDLGNEDLRTLNLIYLRLFPA